MASPPPRGRWGALAEEICPLSALLVFRGTLIVAVGGPGAAETQSVTDAVPATTHNSRLFFRSVSSCRAGIDFAAQRSSGFQAGRRLLGGNN